MLTHKNIEHVKRLIPGKYADLQTVCVGEGILTPDSASTILERFQPLRADGEVANRHLRRHNFRRLTSIFANGEGRITGESIIFNDLGLLMDGRHRVTACVTSGVAVPVLVVLGVPEERFDLIDQGTSRSSSDVFSAMGKCHYAALATAAGSLWGFLYTGRLDKFGQTQKALPRPATSDDLVKLLERHPDLEESVSATKQMRTLCRLVGGQGPISVAHYVMRRVDACLAGGIFGAMDAPTAELTGVSQTMQPALWLRDWLTKQDNQDKTKRIGRSMAYLIKVWNNIRAGRYDTRISYSDSEQFPLIHGVDYGEDGRPQMPWLKTV